jgi:enoyl-CoA hydratase/carnithine racemase
MIAFTQVGKVFEINLGDGENRFSVSWIQELSEALDDVANTEGPRAVITTATGKFWSNGLDLDWMIEHRDEITPYIKSMQHLLVQFLTLPAYSIAVLQGHCFAGGALLALAQDERVMRQDRGFFCLPEVDLGIPFTPGMTQLIQAKLSADTAVDAMLTGRRFGGEEAHHAGIVQGALSEEELRAHALERAESLASKAGPTLQAIRTQMYRSVIASLESDSGLTIPE